MMSGATGSMAAFRGKGIEVQAAVCKKLGLRPVTASTQIIQRDRYIEYIDEAYNAERQPIGNTIVMHSRKLGTHMGVNLKTEDDRRLQAAGLLGIAALTL